MPYQYTTPKGEKKWKGQVVKDGRRVVQTFKTKAKAVEWEVLTKKLMDDGEEPFTENRERQRIRTGYSLGEWATDYLDYFREHGREATYKEKQAVFRHFFKTFDKDMPVRSLTKKDVLRYMTVQHKIRTGNAVNKDVRKNLKAAFNWAIRYGVIDPMPNPFEVDRLPEERHDRYVPPEADFWKVYQVVTGPADRLLLLAYIYTGARRTELFTLRWVDVDFAGSRIRLWTNKRKGAREYDWIEMRETLFNSLLAHKQESRSEWVFPNPKTGLPYTDRKKWLAERCAEAKVRPFGFHAIRHLTASILASNGVPVIAIQEILRHRNSRTTERYLHNRFDMRSALKVLEGGKPQEEPSKNPPTQTVGTYPLRVLSKT